MERSLGLGYQRCHNNGLPSMHLSKKYRKENELGFKCPHITWMQPDTEKKKIRQVRT